MTLKQAAIACSAATLLAWGFGFAQQGATGQPGSQQPPSNIQAPAEPVNPATTNNPATTPSASEVRRAPKASEKEKHWSGSLVDVNCVASALSAGNSSAPSSGARPNVPHFMAGGDPQMSPRTGGTMGPAQGPMNTPQQYPAGNSPDMSQPDAAQMAKAEKVDSAAKQCVPTASTQIFGLALSDGQVMKFDELGNTKASEAVKDSAVQPGKKVKAKVTGTIEGNDTVKVASVEVKGKRNQSPASAPSGG